MLLNGSKFCHVFLVTQLIHKGTIIIIIIIFKPTLCIVTCEAKMSCKTCKISSLLFSIHPSFCIWYLFLHEEMKLIVLKTCPEWHRQWICTMLQVQLLIHSLYICKKIDILYTHLYTLYTHSKNIVYTDLWNPFVPLQMDYWKKKSSTYNFDGSITDKYVHLDKWNFGEKKENWLCPYTTSACKMKWADVLWFTVYECWNVPSPILKKQEVSVLSFWKEIFFLTNACTSKTVVTLLATWAYCLVLLCDIYSRSLMWRIIVPDKILSARPSKDGANTCKMISFSGLYR